ncbi:MAG: MATE family efflux transporter [Clostridia bacterium]|nr:MATE family efflux transporter [Clostridia bacterium]
MATKRSELNMTEGPFLKKIILFMIPLVLTGLLQTLYNAADLVVVGRFRGELALAAVGCTGSLTNLIVGLFMGLSVGAGVLVAHAIGAGEQNRVEKVVHNSVLLSGILGIFVAVVGVIFAPQLLAMMDTPDTVLAGATLYLRIILCGVPASMLYNYCAAMVRSTGDTKHPLIFLTVSGVINVVLNVILVAFFGMGVEGVAIATITSQYLSAGMILVFMMRSDTCIRFSPKKLGLDGKIVKKILYIGVPSGIQGCLFSFSNVLIQSSINSFGDVVMAGSAAGANIDAFVYIAMNAVYHASLTFVGQNMGAKKYKNIKRITILCAVCATVIGIGMSVFFYLFREFFVGLYVSGEGAIREAVMEAAFQRMKFIMLLYFLCGIMEVCCGTMRGMGKSITAMVISLLGACAFRILWLETVFQLFPVIECVYLSYPISWTLTIVAYVICLMIYYRRLVRPKNELLR